jgi:hypothetical protein
MTRFLAAIVGSVLVTVPAYAMDVAGPAPDDTCFQLAEAKHDQWLQRRVLIQQKKTFADGSTKDIAILVTENTAYLQARTQWRSRSVSIRERAVPSAGQILTGMGLAHCTKDATVQEANQAATLYAYDYLPDDKGFVAHGKMWVSDATGLPLKEEMQDPAPPANAMVANAIAATYSYNDDVQVPAGAELADSTRLFNAAQLMRHLQSGSGTAVGGGSR